ncbi:MAG: methionine synthase [Deltaproteobacteria bacterium]|nr:methionine synthase [Deltaproteobacteria bacterium]
MTDRIELLRQHLDHRVLCLDGAGGTYLQNENLTAEDFGGEEFEGCNENLVLTRPDVILGMHQTYLACGADIVETNTFGSTDLVLAEYPPLQEQAWEITHAAAVLARKAADEYTAKTPGKPRFVAGSMGPTTKAISVTGGVTFEELITTFREQGRALLAGGADYLLLETCQDTRNIKAGLIGIRQLSEELGRRVPVAVSGTIEPMGTMLAGQTAESLAISVAHHELLYIGLNCATGPSFMTDHIRSLAELAQTRVACVPNAGLPDEDGNYLETPEMLSAVLGRFGQQGWLNVIGGCCGTTPAHVESLAKLAAETRPRDVPKHNRALYSGIDWVESTEDNRPLLVGERTNVIGSRKFKRLIVEEKFEEASEIARAQVKKGAHIVDVCLANPDRDELADMEEFLGHVINKVKAPLMIDSTQVDVIERALTYCQGKAIINSINLEDGEERFDEVVPMARRFGAAFVVGCIDEDKEAGMAVTRERKLEVAKRSHDLLVHTYGVPPEDIIFDPLVFPCATGDANYLGSALETVEGVRLIKEHLPHCKTVLGISNVSFGLPNTGREVMNSVFLYECTKAGLDMAIVNTQKLERYASIPPEERKLAEDVLFRTTDENLAAFVAHFRGASSRVVKEKSTLTVDERLASYIVEGTKEGLTKDLDAKLTEGTVPLDIINGPLMTGMDEVGRLFNDNQLIVAEVLQSAEAMKAAVAHLEPHMPKGSSASKGKVVLATVKGDVHDIGKNLVEIILGNNGYEIVNLGIKVPPVDLVQAVKEHQPDILGLSGLLVKSAQMMVLSAEEMTVQGCTPDMLVGGAALTRNFTRKRIANAYGGRVLYAKDAMDGLAWANKLVNDDEQVGIDAFISKEAEAIAARAATPKANVGRAPKETASDIALVEDVPAPPDFDRHVIRSISLDEVWNWINPKMLQGKHLGFKGDYAAALEAGDPKATSIHEVLEQVRAEARAGRMNGKVVWQWFEAAGEGDSMRLWARGADDPVVDWTLPRQKGGGICLSDYVRPRSPSGERTDAVCLFATTFGEGVRDWSQVEKEAGNFLLSHAIQAVALEAAEASAEWIHGRIRGHWGFPDAPDMVMKDRFKAKYHGKRYSPGYPACPELEMQEGLFAALKPEDIGIHLTDGHMMEPEASVSALVLHHPQARYFGA